MEEWGIKSLYLPRGSLYTPLEVPIPPSGTLMPPSERFESPLGAKTTQITPCEAKKGAGPSNFAVFYRFSLFFMVFDLHPDVFLNIARTSLCFLRFFDLKKALLSTSFSSFVNGRGSRAQKVANSIDVLHTLYLELDVFALEKLLLQGKKIYRAIKEIKKKNARGTDFPENIKIV